MDTPTDRMEKQMMTCCMHGLRTFVMVLLLASCTITAAFSVEPTNIGSRLELFVDDHLIGEMKGDVRQQLLQPEPQDIVFVAGNMTRCKRPLTGKSLVTPKVKTAFTG
jgi:hypothetical protein